MPSLGWQELVIILVIVVIIFGVGKLPEIGGALGKGIKEFKTNVNEDEEDVTVVEPNEVTTKPKTPAKEEL
ncbi:MAG TPA: twin-arginine translocase TatA/TatE family subunit [Thermomicrobiales bacterium]|nr:twin-arginine translocase TatA/TatE family subunit [Thermomicrobiales bacterium]